MPMKYNPVQGLHICNDNGYVSMGGTRFACIIAGLPYHGHEISVERTTALQDAIDLIEVLRERRIFTAADAREFFSETQEEINEIDKLRDKAEEYKELYSDAEDEIDKLRDEAEEYKELYSDAEDEIAELNGMLSALRREIEEVKSVLPR